jgi:DNA-binding IclR family transcriptional regulator
MKKSSKTTASAPPPGSAAQEAPPKAVKKSPRKPPGKTAEKVSAKTPRKAPSKLGSPTWGTQSIYRAVTMLREIASHGSKGVRLVDLAKVLDLESPTAHRIVKGLMAQGMVSQDPQTKLHRLGHVVYELGLAASPHFQLKELCHATLDRIRQKTGDSVFLMVRSGTDAVCLEHLEGTYPIQTRALDIGGRRPLGAGAGSLALLLELPEAECERIITLNKERYPLYGNASADRVRAAIVRSRSAGYAVNVDDVLEGVTAIGHPVRIGTAPAFAAISVAAIGYRLRDERRMEIAELLQKAVRQLERQLAAKPDLWPQ